MSKEQTVEAGLGEPQLFGSQPVARILLPGTS